MIQTEDRALLTVALGKTFSDSLSWTTSKNVYRKVTGASKDAPCVLTVVGHGMPPGWLFTLSGIKGMVQLNEERYYAATVLDANRVELNDVDASEYPAYEGGGILRYLEPAVLTGMTARMQFRPTATSTTVYADLTTANGGIIFDTALAQTKFVLTPVQTAAIAALLPATPPVRGHDLGVFDIELVAADGSVPLWTSGDVEFVREITR